MKRFFKDLVITLAVVIVAFLVLITCDYFLLWKPSLQGKCERLPALTRPHLARFRGQVVGKNLWIIQYRWLRRRFKAVGTRLSLIRELPGTEDKGNDVQRHERVADVVVDQSGRFDFGALMPGQYDLFADFPGEGGV